jgi:hypothetical protein
MRANRCMGESMHGRIDAWAPPRRVSGATATWFAPRPLLSHTCAFSRRSALESRAHLGASMCVLARLVTSPPMQMPSRGGEKGEGDL